MRVTFDSSNYYDAKAKLPQPDGKHCIICGKELPKNKKKYCGDECFRNWYRGLVKDWSVIRDEVIKRDNQTCVRCGITQDKIKKSFEVHHIIPVSKNGDMWNKSNLICVCHECHVSIHKEIKNK